jgi:3-hydroxyacyl-CoA dehydrogenase
MTDPVKLARDGAVAIVTLDNPPVNAINTAMRRALDRTFAELANDDGVKAVVLKGAGRAFSAGADVSEFGQPIPADAPTVPQVIERIETLSKPVIAAIHGFCFGGALELALGCHYRIATKDTKVGLTEVTLGLIPGAGGTQRLPRLTGFENAVELICEGRRVGAGEALALGIVDRLADGDLDAAAKHYADELIGHGEPVRRTGEIAPEPPVSTWYDAATVRLDKRMRGRSAPKRALESIAAVLELPFEEGLKREREIFLDCRAGEESAALRYLFKAERDAARLPEDAPETVDTAVETAGVVGLGTMGRGIAIVFAGAGIPVTVLEADEDRLDGAMQAIRAYYDDRLQRGRMSADQVAEKLALIRPATETSALAEADVVVEAVIEDRAAKHDVLTSLAKACKDDALIATNTSSLSIDALALEAQLQGRLVGMHFFSPAQVMKLLEVVRGERTGAAAAAHAMALGRSLGKVPVLVGDGDGFVANRMYHRYTWQAYFLLQEGALPEQVDGAMETFGFPMGCLKVGDLSGLDVAWSIRKRHNAEHGKPDPYPEVADRICEAGRFGRKTGAGWYAYPNGRTPESDDEVKRLIEEVSAELGIVRRAISPEEIQQRCLMALINEGARILDEGLVRRASDIDVIWRYGYGFPDWKGGPMFQADRIGAVKVLETLAQLFEATGLPAFDPAPLVARLAAEGKGFLND